MTEMYLTASEVAQRFRLNLETVYRLARRGQLPAVKIGDQWRFHEADLQLWTQTHTNQPNEPPKNT